ncbi:MAG: LysR family transcriptional regulator [Verrucomicrobiales bacterium]|nr:LysR family transcriptional regulator [Verrucomicrobiales bacterium]
MELRQLRYFCTVAEKGNFTRAAKACNVSQPSLSQQIIGLENELGEPLFIRHPRRIELTEAGEMLLTHARNMLREAEAAELAFRRRTTNVEGTVKIGAIPTIAPYLVPSLLSGFAEHFPSVRIIIREDTTSAQVELLGKSELDLAIVSDITTADRKRWSLHFREIFRERLLLALPSSHELATRSGAIPLAELPRDEIILLTEGHCLSEQTMKVCRLERSNEKLECGQIETLLAMIEEGMGVGIVPEMTARNHPSPRITYQAICDPEPARVIALLRRKSENLSTAVRAVLNYSREQMPSIHRAI